MNEVINASPMKYFSFVTVFFCLQLVAACQSETPPAPAPVPVAVPKNPASIGTVGDTADVRVTTQSGYVLMGGGTDVDEAMRWMIDRAKGGDVVVIRASGSTGYNQYLYDFQNVNSVETLLINSKELANNPRVAARIRQAEMVFIAGGDQANYINFWKDTAVEDALNYLISTKKVPIGGTSAGCAILGELIFDAQNGSVTSEEALRNPFDPKITFTQSDFLQIGLLKNLITDMHYDQRSRQGRHVAFLGRLFKERNQLPRGIGVDEKTAVCISETGKAVVVGNGKAYFLEAANTKPEICEPNKPLTWDAANQAVTVYELTDALNDELTMPDFKNVRGGKRWRWYVLNGELKQVAF